MQAPGRFTRRGWLSAACCLISTLGTAGEPRARPGDSTRVRSLRVTVISTMLADNKGVGEWGFAALVEADGHRLLFDTGHMPDTARDNLRALGIDLTGVRDLVLSHHHGDHTGGFLTLRRAWMERDPKALSRAYVGKGIFLSRPGPDGRETNETIAMKGPFEETGGAFIQVDAPKQIFPGCWLTGPVPRRHPERNWSGQGKVRTPEGLVDDTLPEDMALVVNTEQGLVVITGCGHAGVVNTLEYARSAVRAAPIHALIGGVHLFRADEATLDWTARQLAPMPVVQFLGTHCTGIEAVYVLREKLGLDRRTCVVGAVGSGFELGKGIIPGLIAR